MSIDPVSDQLLITQIPFEDVEFTVLLVPHSVRSSKYEVVKQIEDGSYIKVEPSPVRTMRGTLLEVPGSAVAASLLDDGLYARVKFTDGDLYWVEPIGTRVAGRVYLRNWDTNHWDLLESFTQSTSDSERIYANVPNPNAYLKDSNRKIRVRIFTTGKVVNVPDGYIFRIDHMQVDVTP